MKMFRLEKLSPDEVMKGLALSLTLLEKPIDIVHNNKFPLRI